MNQLKNLADNRLVYGCIYCGGSEGTRDHVPSRVLLDPPFPENLPVVGACSGCNNSFSLDEEYFVCLIESVIAGSTDPERIRRPAVATILRRAPKLRARIEAAKADHNGELRFYFEPERINNVLLKLARGHAAFELSQVCRKAPTSMWWHLLPLMSQDERDSFDAIHVPQMIGEVGSRALQRLQALSVTSLDGTQQPANFAFFDWVEVQEDRYRYLAVDDGGIVTIKMIISEYLACEVKWAG